MGRVPPSLYSGLTLFSILAVLSNGYTTSCTEDPCVNGFCSLENGNTACSCSLGWSGETCEEEDVDYTAVVCENGFVGVHEEAYACYCNEGWEGSTCSEVQTNYDPCLDINCNSQGFCSLNEDTEAECNCFDGYSGDQCQHEDTACSEEYLMNIASTVYDESWNAGLDCSFFIGLLWSDMVSNQFSGYPGLCTCLDMMTVNITDWADNLGCVIEENFPMSLWSMNNIHCNHCTDDEILDMKADIQNYSVTCDMFITYRDEMPLYWRTPLKCVCLNSLGDTREEVGEWVYCPFTSHAARTDLTAYDNCNNPEVTICDFTYLKAQIESNMKARNPSGFETCTNAMIDLFDMVPSGGFFANLPDDWCPCYESISEYWSDGLDVLDCNAVTFYEFTIKDLFLLYCNDAAFENKDDLWSVAKIATQASTYDYVTGAICQNFVVYGSALTDSATDASLLRAKTLLCECMERLEVAAVSQGYEVNGDDITWTSYIPDQFADGVLYMQDLFELFPNELADMSVTDCDFVTDDSIFNEEYSTNSQHDGYSNYFKERSTIQLKTVVKEKSNSVDYTTLNICLGLFCALLTGGNVAMFKSVRRGRQLSNPSVMAV